MDDTTKPTLDANALDAMARERPDDHFLKGSGVVKLIDAIRKLERQARDMSAVIHDLVVAEQAAWIEWRHGQGAEAAMTWIHNGLAGPGHIPDAKAPYGTEPQAWFDLHKSDAFPACFCGRPSNQLWMKQGFCSVAHYDQRRRELATASTQPQGGTAAGDHHG